MVAVAVACDKAGAGAIDRNLLVNPKAATHEVVLSMFSVASILYSCIALVALVGGTTLASEELVECVHAHCRSCL